MEYKCKGKYIIAATLIWEAYSRAVSSLGFEVYQACFKIQALLLTFYMNMRKFLNLSEPQFPHLQKEITPPLQGVVGTKWYDKCNTYLMQYLPHCGTQ